MVKWIIVNTLYHILRNAAIILVLYFSLAMNLLLAISLVLVARFFLNRETAINADWRLREEEWRTREKRLTDELLRYAHVPALEVRQERIAKIPDAETAPMLNDIDMAMYLDDIKEDLEQVEPDAAFMGAEEAKTAYPIMWAEMERRYKTARQPLRIAS
jgi:hypothetical protein